MKKSIPLVLFLAIVFFFFKGFFLHGLLPIPADTLVGLYHPFRDVFAKEYPRGVPFKNFLITDPIRQTYPWRFLAISLEKKLQLPLWNPYSFSGYPLMANMQSSAWYPLNIFLFLLPFSLGWSLLIFLEPLLAGLFTYGYLKNLKISSLGSFLGAFTFSFSGFFVAWFAWGNLLHIALWLPLMLLSVDKLFGTTEKVRWFALLVLSLVFSFLAGHAQLFFYVGLSAFLYFLFHVFISQEKIKYLGIGVLSIIFFLILTTIQLIPTVQLIFLSARNIDQANWHIAGWFIPYQHLIQFIVPDFFGNPATLNYWGVWNYGEFIGYVGILPLILGLSAIVFVRAKKIYFFAILFIASLLFALPTFLGKLPFLYNIPFIDSSQPTRLLLLVDLSLAVLSGYGFDFLQKAQKKLLFIWGVFGLIFLGIWTVVLMHTKFLPQVVTSNILVAKHNLIFPTTIFASALILIVLFIFIEKRLSYRLKVVFLSIILLVAVVDQIRFAEKFNPFTPKDYLYPQSTTISFLQSHIGGYRFMTTDSEIMPPNVSDMYRLQSIEGYDPLYIKQYGEFIAAMQRNEPDISGPFGFNRIITPHDISSPLINLLGVKYVLSLSDISSPSLVKVFQEGKTRVYENKNVLSRAFFVAEVTPVTGGQQAINAVFANENNLGRIAVVESSTNMSSTVGNAKIVTYTPNKITIQTQNTGQGFLVLTDIYYPTWQATVDGKKTTIYKTDFTFRGIVVPAGKHTIVFTDQLL